jgi:hypothetical protein
MNLTVPSTGGGKVGLGDITKGAFIVPQNPIVPGLYMANSNPVVGVRLRRSTGTSGVGQLRRVAALHGLGMGQVCDPSDVACLANADSVDLANQDLSQADLNAASLTLSNPDLTVSMPQPGTSGYSLSFPQGTVAQTQPPGYNGQLSYPPGVQPPQPPAGYQWAQVINQSGQQLASVLAVAQGGAALKLANGSTLIYGSPASAATAGVAGAVSGVANPAVLLIGGAVLLFLFMGRGK